MEDDKKSFIFYTNYIETFEALSDEQAGQLIKAILNYASTQKVQELDGLIKIAFIPIKQNIDRDMQKWKEQKKKRSEAGKKGMAARWGNGNENDGSEPIKIDNETQINKLVSAEYITRDDPNIQKYDEFINLLKMDYTIRDVNRVIDYFIKNKHQNVTDKLAYFQESMANNLEKISKRQTGAVVGTLLDFKNFLES